MNDHSRELNTEKEYVKDPPLGVEIAPLLDDDSDEEEENTGQKFNVDNKPEVVDVPKTFKDKVREIMNPIGLDIGLAMFGGMIVYLIIADTKYYVLGQAGRGSHDAGILGGMLVLVALVCILGLWHGWIPKPGSGDEEEE